MGIGNRFQPFPLDIQLVNLPLLMAVGVEPVSDEAENLCPGQLNDGRKLLAEWLVALTTQGNQSNAKPVSDVLAGFIDVGGGRRYAIPRQTANRNQDAVNVLALHLGPRSIQGAAGVGLDFRDDDIDQVDRKAQRRGIVDHWVFGVID